MTKHPVYTQDRLFPGAVIEMNKRGIAWARLIDRRADGSWLVNAIKPGGLEDFTAKPRVWQESTAIKGTASPHRYPYNRILEHQWPEDWQAICSERYTWVPNRRHGIRANDVALSKRELSIYLDTREMTAGRHKIFVVFGATHTQMGSDPYDMKVEHRDGEQLTFELGPLWLPIIRRLIMEGAVAHILDLYQWHRSSEGLEGLLERTPFNGVDTALWTVTGIHYRQLAGHTRKAITINSGHGNFCAPYEYAGVLWANWDPYRVTETKEGG